MTTYFADTSALAKRYVNEPGSLWVKSWIDRATNNIIVVSELAYVEIQSVFTRHIRSGRLSLNNSAQLRSNFLIHYENDYLYVLIDTRLIISSGQLINRYGLRTLDAIQLACAKEASTLLQEPITFVSADTNLLAAAVAEGFAVDNPNNHP